MTETEIVAESIKKLSAVVSSPEYIKIFKAISQQPPEKRKEFAEMVANPEELTKRGIEMPKDFRITTRVFEAPSEGASSGKELYTYSEGPLRAGVESDPLALTICASVGVVVCVSVGG